MTARAAIKRCGRIVAAVLVGCAITASVATPARAAANRAVVVIDTGSGVRRVAIAFSLESISGIEALQLAGANPETIGYGGAGLAVCRLFGVGPAVSPQTCLGTPADPRYWAYFRSPSGSSQFQYSGVGASATRIRDGDVEGWRFGTGQAPPYSSFCEVAGCAGSSSVSGAAGSGSSGSSSSSGAQAGGNGGDGSGANTGSTSGGVSAAGAEPPPTSPAPGTALVDPGSSPGAGQDLGGRALTDSSYAIAPASGSSDAGGSPEHSWSDVGARRRPFPYSLAVLAFLLAILAVGIAKARKRRASIGSS